MIVPDMIGGGVGTDLFYKSIQTTTQLMIFKMKDA